MGCYTGPVLTNPMTVALPHGTRLQGNIKKPKEFTDDAIRYGYLVISSESLNLQEALSGPD
jgi:hypothetical protein